MKVTTKIDGDLYLSKKEKEAAKQQLRDEMTLNKAFQEYYVQNYTRLSTYTLQSYENVRKNHLRSIMKMRVDDLTDEYIQWAFNLEHKYAYKYKTRQNWKYMVKQVLKLVRPDFHPVIIVKKDDPIE